MTGHPEPRGTEKKKRLLLIEDEEVILQLLRENLVDAGYEVAVARDGISGLALIKEMKPDLVLLDMLLPGLSGFEMLEKLKEEGLLPALPVLVISNSGQPLELERVLHLGVRDYLIKVNFDPHEVRARVQSILQVEGEASAGSGSPSGSKAAAGRPAVLIVEDDFLLAGLLECKFAEEGYRVYKALDADQAKRALESNPVDAILLDMVLPGVDGFTFLGQIKRDERWKGIPVVVISNLGQEEEVEKGLHLGAADYIVKANISPAEIVQKVESVLKR